MVLEVETKTKRGITNCGSVIPEQNILGIRILTAAQTVLAQNDRKYMKERVLHLTSSNIVVNNQCIEHGLPSELKMLPQPELSRPTINTIQEMWHTYVPGL